MSEVHLKGEDWRDDWRLTPQVPRRFAVWVGGQLPWILSGRGQVEEKHL